MQLLRFIKGMLTGNPHEKDRIDEIADIVIYRYYKTWADCLFYTCNA